MPTIRKWEARVLQEMVKMGGMERPLHATGLDSTDANRLRNRCNCGPDMVRRAITELNANGLVKKMGQGRWQVVSTEYEILNDRAEPTKEEITKLREAGLSWDAIAKRYRMARARAKAIYDPAYAKSWEDEKERSKIRKRMLREVGYEYVAPKKIERPILVDTRTLTGVLMGDPIPNDPRRKALQSSQ